jgi:hypothetical protein
MITAIQGTDIPLFIDFGSDAPLTSIEWRFFKQDAEKTTAAKFRYPTTTGYGVVTVNGTIYSIVIPKATTTGLIGSFGLEVLFEKNSVTLGAQTVLGSIILKAK